MKTLLPAIAMLAILTADQACAQNVKEMYAHEYGIVVEYEWIVYEMCAANPDLAAEVLDLAFASRDFSRLTPGGIEYAEYNGQSKSSLSDTTVAGDMYESVTGQVRFDLMKSFLPVLADTLNVDGISVVATGGVEFLTVADELGRPISLGLWDGSRCEPDGISKQLNPGIFFDGVDFGDDGQITFLQTNPNAWAPKEPAIDWNAKSDAASIGITKDQYDLPEDIPYTRTRNPDTSSWTELVEY